MPGEVRRKVQRAGGKRPEVASLYMTLPRPWARYERIEEGDEVRILFDGVCVVLPPRTTKHIEARVRALLEAAGSD